jgi:uncharacterized protein (DUF983 family)
MIRMVSPSEVWMHATEGCSYTERPFNGKDDETDQCIALDRRNLCVEYDQMKHNNFAAPTSGTDSEKFRWIVKSGWKGLCPRCGEGNMFKSWLKIADRCECCGLDNRFAAPDDGPAFFSLCIIALPLVAFVVWMQVAFDPPAWVHLITSVPFMLAGTLLPLRPIKGWLVASQFVNRAQEAGTQQLWSQLHGTEQGTNDFDQ